MAVSTIDPNGLNIGQIGGRRRLNLNGDMRIAQRGTSLTGITSANKSVSFLVDRVKFFNANAGPTYTVTQEQDAPDGFRYSWKVETTTANASPASTHYSLLRTGLFEYNDIEGLQWSTSSAKQFTVSFWVKSSLTGTQDVIIARHGSVQRHISSQFTINSANTWEYKTFTIVGDTGGDRGSDTDNQHAFSVDMFLYAGSNYTSGTAPTSWVTRSGDNARAVNNLGIGATTNATFQITGLQMEIGDVATPFEYRLVGEELSACQRYFQIASVPQDYSDGVSNTNIYRSYLIATTMRVDGTASIFSQISYFQGGSGVNTTPTVNAYTDRVRIAATGLSAPAKGLVGGAVALDAEL